MSLVEQRLAECQARERRLREALTKCGTDLSLTYKQIMGVCNEALALPSDDTALREYGARLLEKAIEHTGKSLLIGIKYGDIPSWHNVIGKIAADLRAGKEIL